MAQGKMAVLLKPWVSGSSPSFQGPSGTLAKGAPGRTCYPWTIRRRMYAQAASSGVDTAGSFQERYAKAFPGSKKERPIRPPNYDLRTDEPWRKYLDTKMNNNMTIGEFLSRFAQGKAGIRTYRSQRAKMALPEARGRPLLIWQALDNRKAETQKIEQLLQQSEDKFVVVLGTAGSGKSRCMFELLSNEFGFYYSAETDVNRASGDTVYVQRMMPVLMDDVYDVPKRDQHAEQHGRALLLGRMLVLDYLFRLRVPTFSPYVFLQLQVEGPRLTGTDLFRELTAVLATEYTNEEMVKQIDLVWSNLQYGVRKLRVILDEGHVLYHCRPNVFPLRKSHLLPIYIYNPLVKSLLFPSSTMKGHEVVVCGTGLELLTEGNKIGPLKTTPVLKFADFQTWDWPDEPRLRSYLDSFMQISPEEVRALLVAFRGRLKPLVNCVEGFVGGVDPNGKPCTYKSIENAIADYERHTLERTDARFTHAYCLKELKVIDKPTYDLVRNVYRAFAWWGDFFEAITLKELKMSYLGFARLKTVPLDDPAVAECVAGPGQMIVGHMGDEPLICKALHKHFSADAELLEELRVSKLVQGKGRLWEMHLFDDLVRLFDGKTPLNTHALLKDVELPEVFKQAGEIVNANRTDIPLVLQGNINYGLVEYLRQPEESRPALLVCESIAGPDCFFFVRLADQRTIGVSVFVKYKHRSKSYAAAMHYTDPEAAYTRWTNEEVRKDARIQDAKRQAYEEYLKNTSNVPWSAGLIRLMLTYPAAESSGQETRVMQGSRGGPQLVVEISEKNAGELFGEEHRKVLELTKPIRLLDVRPEPVRDDFF